MHIATVHGRTKKLQGRIKNCKQFFILGQNIAGDKKLRDNTNIFAKQQLQAAPPIPMDNGYPRFPGKSVSS